MEAEEVCSEWGLEGEPGHRRKGSDGVLMAGWSLSLCADS